MNCLFERAYFQHFVILNIFAYTDLRAKKMLKLRSLNYTLLRSKRNKFLLKQRSYIRGQPNMSWCRREKTLSSLVVNVSKGIITLVRISELHEGFSNWKKLHYDSIKEDQL